MLSLNVDSSNKILQKKNPVHLNTNKLKEALTDVIHANLLNTDP